MSQDSGGDVRLDLMPPEVAQVCRDAWPAIAGERQSVVHGDSAPNVFLYEGRAGFFDWDEARRDVFRLDLADLPGVGDDVDQSTLSVAKRAAHAWEVASSWVTESAYA